MSAFGSQFWPKFRQIRIFQAKSMISSKKTIGTTSIQKIGIFIAVFGSYRSKTGDNGFESSNGSVVSGKILILAVLAIFGSKIHCWW